MKNEKHYCVYCGREATHQFKNGKWCCQSAMNRCPKIKELRKKTTAQVWDKRRQNILPIKQKPEIPYKICFYCGSPAEYQLKNGKWCCQPFSSQCPSIRKKNSQKINSLYKKENGKVYFNGKLRVEQHTEENKKIYGWNKGLTKDNCQSLKLRGQALHERYVKGEIIHHQLGKAHTDQWKDKMMNTRNNNPITTFDNSIGYKNGWYKGYWCDSSWELAYIIYNLDHGIFMQRNLKGFPYEFKGKERRYYPDFILEDGTYVEIKGFHSQLTDQKIKSFPKDLTIKILYEQDMSSYLEYAKNKYGNDYWKLLEKEK